MALVKVFETGVNISIEKGVGSGNITTIPKRHARYSVTQVKGVDTVHLGDAHGVHGPISVPFADLRNSSDVAYANIDAMRTEFNTLFGA